MLENRTTSEFPAAAAAALRSLHERLGFDLWLIARAAGDDWIVLHALDHGVGLREGTVVPWSESLCAAMVAGHGPRLAPRVADVPAYAKAALGRRVPIGAYAGVPLKLPDGSLFGTLCALHPTELPKSVAKEVPVLELVGGLLSSLLSAEARAQQQSRRADEAWTLALTDELTGLYNRRGWDQLLAAEEHRSRRHGHHACLLALDIDGLKSINDSQGHAAGDIALRRAADCLRKATRSSDVVARIGGDEFAVLAVETPQSGGEALAARLRDVLESEGVAASIGLAVHEAAQSFAATWQTADAAMYADKRRGKVP